MKSILFTNARDEDNILEWIQYHKYIGFTTIFIYDHLSHNHIQDIVNENHIEHIIIERIDTEDIRKTQLMDISVKYSRNNGYDWMLYLDADEYLMLPNDNKIDTFLEKYKTYQQVGINWLMFGSNYHNSRPDGGLLENYTKCDAKLHANIKSFVKPDFVKHVVNPHCYKVQNSNLSIGINYQKLNDINPWHFELNLESKHFNSINAYIAHYIFQSYDTYLKRKKNRKRDDTGGDWHWNYDEKTIHRAFNNIDNFLPKEKSKYI